MAKDNFLTTAPTSEQLRKELERERNKSKGGLFKGIIIAFIAVDAIIVILTTMFFPIMNIHGDSMYPNLENGNLVIAYKTDELARGDVCAFYSGDSVLCKRIIAYGGEVVDINENGVVYINNIPFNEPYLINADLGNTDIEFPYSVPYHTYFVMGDNRNNSSDSRDPVVGNIKREDIIGRAFLRIWPLQKFGILKHQ